jgi:hypothetical protein
MEVEYSYEASVDFQWASCSTKKEKNYDFMTCALSFVFLSTRNQYLACDISLPNEFQRDSAQFGIQLSSEMHDTWFVMSRYAFVLYKSKLLYVSRGWD